MKLTDSELFNVHFKKSDSADIGKVSMDADMLKLLLAIDARLPRGEMTLAKFDPSFEQMSVAEGDLKDYVQYENSDCLNGAILKVSDGRRMLDRLTSHHYLLMTGHNQADIELIGRVFDFQVAEL